MILYYALGEGLGHLRRAAVVLEHLGELENVVVISDSAQGLDPLVGRGMNVAYLSPAIRKNRVSYLAWWKRLLARWSPSKIIVDAFPFGIEGEFLELSLPKHTELVYLCRLLKWDAYLKALGINWLDGASLLEFRSLEGERVVSDIRGLFQQTFLLEEIGGEHLNFVREASSDILAMSLDYSLNTFDSNPPLTSRIVSQVHDSWLVVHSGPATELEQLTCYAQEQAIVEKLKPRIVVINQREMTGMSMGFRYLKCYPANCLFPLVDRIYTGCGFNSMNELVEFRARHRFIAFARRFDDQALRARRARL